MSDRQPSPGFGTRGQFEAILDRFEAAWRAGQRPKLTEFLVSVPETSRAALFHELLSLELAYRRDAGEAPNAKDYAAKYPQFAEQVRRLFELSSADEPPRVPSTPHGTDRNLLVGILALQMDFITRDQLIAGMSAWVLDKAKPLDQVLLDQKVLRSDTQVLLAALVDKHLELHGGDPQQSLAALSSVGDVKDELRSVRDAELSSWLATRS